MKLTGKTALVTGSTRRIGRSIAMALAEKGVNIVIHARRKTQEAEELCNQIRTMSVHCILSTHDLRDTDNTSSWFEETIQKMARETGGDGTIDILVNSACEYHEDSYQNITPSSLNTAMAVQVLSPLAMMHSMRKHVSTGSVVNILDTRFSSRDPLHTSYHLAKRSLHCMSCDMAAEYAPQIRVNAVAPGIILPPAGKGEEWLKHMASTNPMQRHGRPEDVSEAVLYLIQADFVTGQVIYVDGGRHLGGKVYAL